MTSLDHVARFGLGRQMYLEAAFERIAAKTPVTVMTRAALEHALAPADLDALFAEKAVTQYERSLLFSSVVDLMGVVVAKVQPSLHAAYQAVADTLPVSLTSVYNKLNRIEPEVVAAMVRHTAARLRPVIEASGGAQAPWLPGYRVRILDGNHLAATQRRLDVLRGCAAGPLPGHSLVILEPDVMLAVDMLPCEDGHAQERSLTDDVLACVEANDCWIADRNFCTLPLLFGIADRRGAFVVRQHANVPLVSAGTLRRRGRIETGEVFEQDATLGVEGGRTLGVRRVVIRLDTPTRDGDTELAIVTNLPADKADALAVAALYRKRWTLETLFFELTQTLAGELETLGYPRAALFGFGIALASYNVLATVKASLRAAFGHATIEHDVSGYFLANEVRRLWDGLDLALDDDAWVPFRTMPTKAFARQLVAWAAHVKLATLRRHPRGPKKPVPKRTRHKDKPHVSTARLLAEARGKRP